MSIQKQSWFPVGWLRRLRAALAGPQQRGRWLRWSLGPGSVQRGVPQQGAEFGISVWWDSHALRNEQRKQPQIYVTNFDFEVLLGCVKLCGEYRRMNFPAGLTRKQSGTGAGPNQTCKHHLTYSCIVLHRKGKPPFLDVYSPFGRQHERRSEDHMYQMHVVYLCMCIYICKCLCMCIWYMRYVYVYVYVYIYICVCVCVCICMCM
jgi:hypothetical protein